MNRTTHHPHTHCTVRNSLWCDFRNCNWIYREKSWGHPHHYTECTELCKNKSAIPYVKGFASHQLCEFKPKERFMILTYHDWHLNHSFYASLTLVMTARHANSFSHLLHILNDYDRFQLIFKWAVSAGDDFMGGKRAKNKSWIISSPCNLGINYDWITHNRDFPHQMEIGQSYTSMLYVTWRRHDDDGK